MSGSSDRLVDRLPRVLRIGDERAGGGLRRLVDALDAPRAVIERDLEQWFADLFIETCDETRLPAFARLLDAPPDSTRAEIANVLQRRRWVGTLDAIVGTARDATGLAVEGVEILPRDARFEGGALAGGHGDATVELFVYATDATPVDDGHARRIGPGRYTFHPLGVDAPLYRHPGVVRSDGHAYVPHPLSLNETHEMICRHVTIRIDGADVSPSRVSVVDLDDWPAPDDRTQVFVDPHRGRLTLADDRDGSVVTADFAVGARSDIGASGWVSTETLESRSGARVISWQDRDALPPTLSTPTGPLDAVIDHSGVHDIDIELRLGAGSSWHLRAASGRRPTIAGAIRIDGPDHGRATAVIDGLHIGGAVTVAGNVDLLLRHDTCMPYLAGDRSVVVRPGASVSIEQCVVGAMHLDGGRATVLDSVIDADGGVAVDADDGVLTLLRTTVLGDVRGDFDGGHSAIIGASDSAETEPAHELASHRFGDPGHGSPRFLPCSVAQLMTDVRRLEGAHRHRGVALALERLDAALAHVVPLGLAVRVVVI